MNATSTAAVAFVLSLPPDDRAEVIEILAAENVTVHDEAIIDKLVAYFAERYKPPCPNSLGTRQARGQ